MESVIRWFAWELKSIFYKTVVELTMLYDMECLINELINILIEYQIIVTELHNQAIEEPKKDQINH